MNHKWWQIGLSSALILALVATLCLGCGKGGVKEKVTITIGNITDMTGPAASACIPVNTLLQDIVDYYNDDEIISGVEFKVISYDARYDPSLDVPAYDWLRDKGAQVLYSPLPTTGESLKSFLDRDKVPMWELSCTPPMLDPPGWEFCPSIPFKYDMETFLKWISENDWDYQVKGRVPSVGLAGWVGATSAAYVNGLKGYCQDHQDKFDFVDAVLATPGSISWTGAVEVLKNCDYVYTPTVGTGLVTFIRQYLDGGGKAKFIGGNSQASFRDLLVNSFGYDTLDGMLFNRLTGRWWNEADTDPQVQLLLELLSRYQSQAQAAQMIFNGGSIGAFHQDCALFDILAETIKNVGAENFSAQAFYDTAINFSVNWESYKTWNFTATKRYMPNHTLVYKWSAADKDLVPVSDWVPVVTEGGL